MYIADSSFPSMKKWGASGVFFREDMPQDTVCCVYGGQACTREYARGAPQGVLVRALLCSELQPAIAPLVSPDQESQPHISTLLEYEPHGACPRNAGDAHASTHAETGQAWVDTAFSFTRCVLRVKGSD
eukprot:1332844-Rhodomonas_salina.2